MTHELRTMDGRRRRRALASGIAIAVAVHLPLAALSLYAAVRSGSAGMTASAVHLGLGLTAHAVALAGVWAGTRPADRRHPYGYDRYEHIASMFVGMLLLGAVGLILWRSLPRLIDPTPIEAQSLALAVAAIAVPANVLLAMLLSRRARSLASTVLAAEATHAWADASAALGVLAGVAFAIGGYPRLDAAMALAISVLIAWRAWRIVTAATGVLTDASAIDLERLRAAAESVPGVRDCHAVRARGESGHLRADLHIHVDPTLTVAEGHAIGRRVDAHLREEFGGMVDLLVHVGPASR